MTDNTFLNIAQHLKARFVNNEDGAVTVDWVVLTAAIVGIAAVAGNSVNDAVTSLGTDIADETASKTVDNGN